ncbi:MAG: putative metal-binding motif-containing protein [Polyangiales bacterium]
MTRALLLKLCLAMGLLVLGCSLLVDPRGGEPRCERDKSGLEVCPMGLHCDADGRCVKSCGIEICGDNIDNDCDERTDETKDLVDTCGDGIDNDCDGEVDEGSDTDRDSFTWCGNTQSPDGGLVDCEPYNEDIYPGATEVCDGRDNDCDLTIDETSGGPLCPADEVCNGSCAPAGCTPGARDTCPSGEVCDPTEQRCVPSRACGDRECRGGERCDTATNTCVVELRENGATCGVDADCRSQTCIRAAALRLASASQNAYVCGQACCSDAECPESQRCFASGSGARSCLPVKMIPASLPQQCSTDPACAAPQICALTGFQSLSAPTFMQHSGLITSTCRTPPANTATLGQRCVYYTGCASRICTPRPGFTGQICSTPCGSTGDCKAFEAAARRAGVTERAYCRYVTVSLDSSRRITDYAPVCVIDRRGETGTGGTNEACSKASDCIDGGCVGATATTKGRCAPTCCTDDQCGRGEDGRAIHCRPFAFGAIYEMRCDLGVSP